ncbi:MAG: HAMP domain-containing histidine kinase [Candidatus Marinimicrobia bacterium]|nr:HAMP domain-containing histidine kinase [Candidatus Neomarinimicrobiota bacterium]
MKFKPTSIILLLIALMPAIFYTIYEFLSLSETDKLMSEIYEKQMDNVLLDINQSAWEQMSNWSENFRKYFSKNSIISKDTVSRILNNEPALHCVFVTDSSLHKIRLFTSPDTGNSLPMNNFQISQKLQQKRPDIDRMIYRKKVGYDKPVTFVLASGDQEILSVLYVYENESRNTGIFGICINSIRFMESLPIALEDFSQEDVEIGIFDAQTGTILDRTGDISPDNAASVKKVWLFPNYLIGVKMKGIDLNEQVKNRFYNRLKWTLFLNSLFIITIIVLYRSIRGEMKLTRIKSDFVSNVSHELRTPLALIRMYAETLALGRVKTEEKKLEYYHVITKESERLSHLVNTILDFSKMESGNKKYNFQTVDLNTIIKEVMEMYSFHLEQKKFIQNINLYPEPLIINGDSQSISEAIINLIDNAMKYSDEIKMIAIESGQDSDYCWVKVSDKGQGISSADITRIFEKFYRVSSHLVHNTKGSGLGLALVDYIMKAHQGKVLVKSKEGKGSTFQLNFPNIKK